MIPRDTQMDLFIEKYYPKYDIFQYKKDLQTKSLVRILSYDELDIQKMYSYVKYTGFTTLGTFISCGILTMKYDNKIPLLNRVENRFFKFFWKSVLLFLPAFGVFIYWNFKTEGLENHLYAKHYAKYKKFKINGDVRDLNSDVKSKFFYYRLGT